MFNYKIIKKASEKQWGGNCQFEGQCSYTDRNGVEILSPVIPITVSSATYKLIEYFQTHPGSEELFNLIDDYGSEKYYQGTEDEAESNAEADY